MGTYVFKLPDIGEGVVEGEITACTLLKETLFVEAAHG